VFTYATEQNTYVHGEQGADILVFHLAVHVVTAVLARVDTFPLITSGCYGCVCFNSSDAVASTPEVRVAATVLLPIVNPLTPNDNYRGRTAPLTSKLCILYIYSTNIGTEYFKHGIYSPFFPLQNAVCFIILTYLVTMLFTFYIQSVPKLKK